MSPDKKSKYNSVNDCGAIINVLDSSSGLANNQIHSLTQDHSSRLWMAGPAGLAYFDGSNVRNFDRRDGLRCAGLRSVGISPNGIIWIGTDLSLEAFDDTGKRLEWIELLDWQFGLTDCIDAHQENPLIGTAHGLVKIVNSKNGTNPRIGLHLDVGFVRHISSIDDSRAYVVTDLNGLILVEGASWSKVENSDLDGLSVTCTAPGGKNHLLVGTSEGAFVLNIETHETIARFRVDRIWPQVSAVGAGNEIWWVAFGRTLAAFSSETNENESVEIYRLESKINDLLTDEFNNTWIATNNNGLAVASCLRHSLQKLELGSDGSVFSIKPRENNHYQIGGEDLLRSIELTQDVYDIHDPLHAGLPESVVWDVHEDASGIWAATHEGLFHAPYGREFTRVFADDPVLGAPARVILPRGDELWVGTLRGLSRIRGGTAQEVLGSDGKPLGYVYAMHLDDTWQVWVATLGRGLWRGKEKLEPVTGDALSPNGNTYAVVKGQHGETVVLQDEKVIILDRYLKSRVVEECHPISGWTAVWLDQDNIAIGSSDGLRILNVSSKTVTMRIRSLFSQRDWEFTNNRTLLRDRYGRLLCGVNGGLFLVDLEKLRSLSARAPEVRLAKMSWRYATPEQKGDEYLVRPGKWLFRAWFYCAWFVDHRSIRYRYKLVGFDTKWSELFSKPEISFNSLPSGEYELLVQAYSPLTGFGPAAEVCKIKVSTPWWAIGWTHFLAGLEKLYNRFVRSKSNNEFLLEQNDRLEREIAERTASLSVTNNELQRMRLQLEELSRTDGLTGLANWRHFDDELRKEISRAFREKTALSLLLLDVDHFKAVNDRLGHQVGDEYLRRIAETLRIAARRSTDIVARYGGEEFVVVLPFTDFELAKILAERMRKTIADLKLPNEASATGFVTVSVGVTAMRSDILEAEEALINRADRALYEAKNGGRNRVEAAPSDSLPMTQNTVPQAIDDASQRIQ
jgi:diguanylate cyclase (GGDEF)-like protein